MKTRRSQKRRWRHREKPRVFYKSTKGFGGDPGSFLLLDRGRKRLVSIPPIGDTGSNPENQQRFSRPINWELEWVDSPQVLTRVSSDVDPPLRLRSPRRHDKRSLVLHDYSRVDPLRPPCPGLLTNYRMWILFLLREECISDRRFEGERVLNKVSVGDTLEIEELPSPSLARLL